MLGSIDLTGEIWDDEFDDEDNDWYLEYSFLDDKPKRQPKKDEFIEPLDHAEHILDDEQLPNTNTHLNSSPTSDTYQTEYIVSANSNQGQLNPSVANQLPVGPTPSNQSMTNTKCNYFPRPDLAHYKPSSLLSKIQNKQAIAKLSCKPSLFKPNLWKPSISCSSNPGPSTNIRPASSPMCKITKGQNKTSHLRKSVNKSILNPGNLYKNKLSPNYSAPQTKRYVLQQERVVQTLLHQSLPRTQHSTDSNANEGEHMHYSLEYGNSPEDGILASSDTQKLMNEAQELTEVEDTTKTVSFHQPGRARVRQEKSNNPDADRELWSTSRGQAGNTSTWGEQDTNTFVSKR